MSNLTRTQQKALALDKHVSVTAGAGSGKTKILIERFLKIVLDDHKKIHRILAITFTNKAAGEMRGRLSSEINNLLEIETGQTARQKLLYIRDRLNSAAVSTIHSFCAKILREFPLECGLSPDINELDELQNIVLKQQAVEKTFSKINSLAAEEIRVEWVPLFKTLGSSRVKNMLIVALGSPYSMDRILEQFKNTSAESYLQFLNDKWLELIKVSLPPVDFDSFAGQVRSILKNDNTADKKEKALQIQKILENYLSVLGKEENTELEHFAAFVKLTAALTTNDGTAYKNLAHLGTKKSWSSESGEILTALNGDCSVYSAALAELNIGLPAGEIDRIWFELFERFLELYKKTRNIYRQLKADSAGIDFEDLQLLTLKLLSENDAVRSEIVSRYDYIMVDEFQDTNELQWEIIRRLAAENDSLGQNNLFVVGDPKQSIYGFRDADIRVFQSVRKQFAEAAGETAEEEYDGNVVFEDSFRFLPRLNSFINFQFSHTLQQSAGNPFEISYQPLNAKRDVPDSGWAGLALLDENETDYIAETITVLIKEGRPCFVFQDDEEVERPVQYGDIAILLRSRNNLLDIEQSLRRLNIPYKTAGGTGFWQRQEIFDFYHLLRFLNNPDDDFALIGVLRSRMIMLSDALLYFLAKEEGPHYLDKIRQAQDSSNFSEEEKTELHDLHQLLHKWVSCRDRMTLSALLDMILDDIQLKTQLMSQINGEQLAANAAKLIESAQFFDESGPGGLQEFISRTDDLIEMEMREGEAQINLEDSGTVKIMTIHAAKGLQFPVVFVPFINSQVKKSRTVMLDSDLGMAVKMKNNDHLLYRLLRSRMLQKESAEAKRLFYVAATRASNYLFISACAEEGKIKNGTALSWMIDVFSESGHDLQESDSIEEQGFTLDIAHGFEITVAAADDSAVLKKGISELRQTLSRDNKEADVPEFLLPLKDTAGPLVFSATRLMTYINDEQEYYRRYHLGFFENDYETFAKDVFDSDSGLLKGRIIHRFLELRRGDAEEDLDVIDQVLFDYEVFDLETQTKLRQEIFEACEKIEKSADGRKILFAAESRNEISLTMRLGDDYFTGTIDRMFRNESGIWEAADYKTNRIGTGQVNDESKKYKWQIEAYALLLSRLFPEQETYPVSLYYLKPDKIFRQEFNKKQIEEIQLKFEDIVLAIKKKYNL